MHCVLHVQRVPVPDISTSAVGAMCAHRYSEFMGLAKATGLDPKRMRAKFVYRDLADSGELSMRDMEQVRLSRAATCSTLCSTRLCLAL